MKPNNIIIGIALALVLSLGLRGTALAHAELVSSDPAAGARLTKAPAQITLAFSEELDSQGSSFTITNEQGAAVGAGKLDLNDLNRKTLVGTPNAALGDGVYTVKWDVITADDKAQEQGAFTFGVNKAAGAQPTAKPEAAATTAATTAATVAAATPRPTVAASGAAQATATATAASPANLPSTGGSEAIMFGFVLLAATLVLAGGAALYRSRAR